jgi:DNA-binding transcriptional LysR family regulator
MVVIAEEGSISGAARRLRLTQPTLSRQLRDLERRLGVDLFTRTGRGLVPTAAGSALLKRAATVLEEAEAVLEDVRLAAQGMSGQLVIGFAGSGINGPLGEVLGRLRRQLPAVDLRLVELFDDVEMSAGVLEGRLDVAAMRLPVRDPGLATRFWTSEALSLFVPAGHPIAMTREPVPISALSDIPLVLWPREAAPHSHDEVLALCHRAGVVPRIAARGRSIQTILALVAAGFGGSVMDDSYRVLHREGVVARRLADTVTSLHLVWRAGEVSPLVTRFLAAVTEQD